MTDKELDELEQRALEAEKLASYVKVEPRVLLALIDGTRKHRGR